VASLKVLSVHLPGGTEKEAHCWSGKLAPNVQTTCPLNRRQECYLLLCDVYFRICLFRVHGLNLV
jgi:hypothetical protein